MKRLLLKIVMPLWRELSYIKLVICMLFSRGKLDSSASDNAYYPLMCYLASKNAHVFRSFKRSRIYREILEHVSRKQGNDYLTCILKSYVTPPDFWRKIQLNDKYGNPITFDYSINDEVIKLSPTTLRYTKVLCDIVSMFDTKAIKSVAEIGVGYGGQCRLIRNWLPNVHYTLIDLPEVVGLAQTYLNHYDECRENICYIDGTHLYTEINRDFVISNYAFSELRREVQDMYLEKVILRSKAGYMTWNDIGQKEFGAYTVEELLAKIPGATRINEEPLTFPNNCIIIWGNKVD